MTKEEILEYNRRCAVFLGCTFEISSLFENNEDRETVFFEQFSKPSWWDDSAHHRYGFLSYQRTEYMLYYSDWNWIMEMVDAIENIKTPNDFSTMFYVEIGCIYCNIRLHPQVGLAFEDIDSSFGNDIEITSNVSKKEAVVQAINQFLIWYENNK